LQEIVEERGESNLNMRIAAAAKMGSEKKTMLKRRRNGHLGNR
jgi:hypothetical protein